MEDFYTESGRVVTVGDEKIVPAVKYEAGLNNNTGLAGSSA